jgi:hypothetical protein
MKAGAADAVGGRNEDTVGVAADPPTGVPQFWQKRDVSVSWLPQLVQKAMEMSLYPTKNRG